MYGLNKAYSTAYRYYINGHDVTFFVMNELNLPKGLDSLTLKIEVIKCQS